MRVFSSFAELKDAGLKNVFVTIGNFDGVHLGHRSILKELAKRAKEVQGQTLLIVFEPQPLEFFTKKIARLFTLSDKIDVLEKGHLVDNLLVLNFDQDLAQTPADDFVAQLCTSVQLHTIFIGDDFHFGKDRSGNIEQLRSLAPKYGYQVDVISTITNENKQRVSSTLIRSLLAANQLKTANELLGQPFSFTGVVEKGRQLARTLDAPTANIQINRVLSPLHGTYACLVKVEGMAKIYAGVCNVGFKPTVNQDQNNWLVEVHLLDFTGDLYGKELKVTPVEFIRPEQKFSSVDELKKQIFADIELARSLKLTQRLLTGNLFANSSITS
ncbi:riboflavin biosynthesis protein RibF [Psittacicella gerlachiana]|uniref:Riboflavin biosynthesis protein n=1 Tax=Psittacicella gerlachiana TaxID=2028574 RepID=A0A3A1YMJ0_9GAMM|nr:riboflavin biosynthesis protein RibF [Psittacicella gerlachiana]RIY38459.1 riboflavin biosynthesis protein RibF [Psittacicella gerlachiana]